MTVFPKTYNGDLANPPLALEPLFLCSRFMIWRWILTTNKKGEQKWTKPPFCAADPGRHAANDRPEPGATLKMRCLLSWPGARMVSALR
jgi:hypothetical protein